MADTSFEIQISATTDGVAASGKAVSSLATSLESSIKAAADATGHYNKIKSALDGVQKQIEATAVKQAILNNQLAKAEAAGNARKVAGLKKQLEDLSSVQEVLAAQETRLSAHYKDKAAAVDKARAAVRALEDAQKKQGAAAKGANLNELQEGLGKLGGPFGRVAGYFIGLAAGFSKVRQATGSSLDAIIAATGSAITGLASGLASAAALLTKVGVGAGLAAGAIGAMALRSFDAARSQGFLYAGITQSTEAAKALAGNIDRVAAGVPLSRDEVSKLGEDLARSGLRGKELDKAIEGAAVQAARLKFGPEWQAQMLSLPKQLDKLQVNIRGLFANLNIDKALVAFSRIVELFDASTASGRALQAIAERFFGAVIGKSDDLAVAIEAMALKAEIAVMTFLLQWRAGSGEYVDRVREMIAVGRALWDTLVLIVQVAAVVAAGLTVAGAAVLAVIAAITTAASAVASFVVGALLVAVGLIQGMFGNFSLFEIGMNVINGFAAGILEGGKNVLNALTSVANTAIGGAKAVLGIASPSKVFAEIGSNTAAGMAVGIDSGAPAVASAVEGITSPSAILPEAKTGGASGAAQDGGGATASGNTFNFYGVQGAEDARAKFEETLMKVLQGAITQGGGGLVGA